MGLQTHLFRRNATYAWRRRLPAQIGGGLMQISLRTNDPDTAKRIASVVSAESTHTFDLMMTHGLSNPEARRLLTSVIEGELARISHAQMVRADDSSPSAWQNDQSHDWAMGQALQLLAQRGASGVDLSNQDRDAFRNDGRTDSDIDRLKLALEIESQAFRHPPMSGPNTRVKQAMERALDRNDFTNMEYLEGRKIYMNGRGAGLLAAHNGDSSSADAMDLAERLMQSNEETVEQVLASPPEQAQPVPVKTLKAKPVGNVYDPKITSLMDQKRRLKNSTQMIEQMKKTLLMFIEATGVEDINNLQQVHVAQYADMLHELPKYYRRSSKTRHMSLKQILKAAKSAAEKPEGLSVTTINRNIDYLG